jgi:hypothetical protein
MTTVRRRSTSRNQGRATVSGSVVDLVMSATTERPARRHPSVEQAVVQATVYHAAVELVIRVTDPDRLAMLLE